MSQQTNIARGENMKRKYFTLNERIKIETYLDSGLTPKQIALKLDRHYTSIYREIKRGTVVQIDTNLKEYKKYCADVGQRKMLEKSHNKGVELKIKNDFKTVRMIEKLAIEQKYSPYAISVILGQSCGYTVLSKGTIYNYLHNGIFLNYTDKDMIYKNHKAKKQDKEKRVQYNKTGKKSIEDRPKDILKRDIYGHWELDTVYSGKDKSKACLLVLTERMTRQEIIRKIDNRQAETVLKEINRIEKEYGYRKFKNTFKTITCDNGVEFSKHKEIEQSCIKVGKRTTLYFCHAFASCERGSNENANKLIRKFIPKGTDISLYSKKQIQGIQDIINNYPRKLFNGLSSNQYKALNNIAV